MYSEGQFEKEIIAAIAAGNDADFAWFKKIFDGYQKKTKHLDKLVEQMEDFFPSSRWRPTAFVLDQLVKGKNLDNILKAYQKMNEDITSEDIVSIMSLLKKDIISYAKKSADEDLLDLIKSTTANFDTDIPSEDQKKKFLDDPIRTEKFYIEHLRNKFKKPWNKLNKNDVIQVEVEYKNSLKSGKTSGGTDPVLAWIIKITSIITGGKFRNGFEIEDNPDGSISVNIYKVPLTDRIFKRFEDEVEKNNVSPGMDVYKSGEKQITFNGF